MFTSVRGIIAASTLAGSLLAANPALADATDPPKAVTVTGNVALVSDYRFRGLSQSAGDPAIQGSVNINHSSGFYVGFWSSSTDFSNLGVIPDKTYGSQELDLYGGWTGTVSPGLVFDGGLLYYAYPSGHFGKAEFFEPYASLTQTIGPVSAKLGANYAWKQAALDFDGNGKKDDNIYVYGELSAGIPTTPISVLAHLGYTQGALSPKFATGAVHYDGGFDYSLGASFNVTPKLSIGAAYVGVDGTSIKKYSDDTVVGTLKLTF